MKSKNKKLLASFTSYCNKHPDERFWQALRNWSEHPFILTAEELDHNTDDFQDIQDTFYWNGKKKTQNIDFLKYGDVDYCSYFNL